MRFYKPVVIAVSTFSIIPMPQIDWDEQSLKQSVCFLPVAGVFSSVLMFLWYILCSRLMLPALLFAVIAVILPLVVSGGIHMDGFMDTADALASHQSKERKLEIMKDSSCGAFAVMACVFYALLSTPLFMYSFNLDAVLIICIGFVLSRCLSVLNVLTMPNARGSGMLSAMSSKSGGKTALTVLCCVSFLCILIMCAVNLHIGAGAAFAAALHTAAYRLMARKQFGGVTGDTAGWFLTLCELSILAGAYVGGLFL